MPILEVEIVCLPEEGLPAGLASEIANRAGVIFGSPEGGTWVRLRRLEANNYAENGVSQADTPQPVFVRVLKAVVPSGEALVSEVARLTQVIASACGRPVENVHLIYEPQGTGRVAFGGKVV